MDGVSSGFADEMIRRSEKILSEAEPAISRLLALANALKMTTAAGHLEASLSGLRRPEFNMIVFGRFKTGKSTFLNALLGRPEGSRPGLHRPVLVMDPDPATARLTTIRYGEEPSVTVVHSDRRRVERSLSWYEEFAKLDASEAANRARFADIDEFEIVYPFENCRAGIILVDTPGTDEAEDRNAVVRRALGRADAGILLFNTTAPYGEGEIKFAQQMKAEGLTSYFTVVNRYNGRPVDDRLRIRTWEKLVRDAGGGPEYAGQDFAEHRIFFIDALTSLEGVLAADETKIVDSGLAALVRALNRFYETDRRKVHVQRWTDLADAQAAQMLERIDGLVVTLSQDREAFQQRYEEIRPRIAEARGRKARVPKMFATFRERASSALLAGFQDLVSDIRDQLPAAMERVELTGLQGLGDKILVGMSRSKRDKAVGEALAAARAFIEERVRAWGAAEPPAQGAKRILEPLFNEFLADLEAEVRQTEMAFERLQFDLSGYQTSNANGTSTTEQGRWWGRILPAAAGLAFGPDMAVLGATRGWKGFGKSLVVHGAVFAALVALGTTNPLGWAAIAGWVTAFVIRSVWLGHDITKEIKQKVTHALIYGDPAPGSSSHGLQNEVKHAGPRLTAAVDDMVREFEEDFIKAFSAEIDEKVQMFEEAQRQNALAREEKTALLEQYEKARVEINQRRATLRSVRRMAATV